MPTVRHAGRMLALGLVCLAAAATISTAADAPLDRNGLPQWTVRAWNDAPVRLELRDAAELRRLLAAVPVAAFQREDVSYRGDPKQRTLVLETRVTEAEFAALTAAGWRPVHVHDVEREGREAVERTWREMAENKAAAATAYPYDYYPTHAEIGTILAAVETAHPAIARDFQWGASVQGRELWGIVISDNVDLNEAEPEVRLSSTIHGDEVVGMVMLLNLAEYLTSNYGQPGFEDVTDLVDNYEIHIMPLHNPDGMVAGGRYNANSVDLNRNFLLPAGTHATVEVENLRYMDYADAHHFVISENAHGGALVVNYPWDYTYTLAPDNDAMIRLSLEYSTYNLPMYNGTFDQGITNGAEWYVATGTAQDWAYDQTGCIDLTIELSNTKWPTANKLTDYWDDNVESLKHFIKASRYGINGVVTASDSGLPLEALVTVAGNVKTVGTDPVNGDYYKLLDTGTYDLTFAADGYITRTITGVSTVWGTPTVLDVALLPAALGAIAGTVYEQGGAPLEALVSAYAHPLDTLGGSTASGPDGTYTLTDLLYGDYRLVYTAPGHGSVEQIVTLNAATVTAPDVTLLPTVEVTPFADGFEDMLSDGWTTAWAVTGGGADGTMYALCDSPDGTYEPGITSPCAMSAGVDLSGLDSGTVSFWAKWDIEETWDSVSFQVSSDGGTAWTLLPTAYTVAGSGQGTQVAGEPYFQGSQAGWVLNVVDLAPWAGLADVRFRFVLASDGSVEQDGFTFDEFTIQGEGVIISGSGNPPLAARLRGVSPNPFNPATNVRFSLARDGEARLDVFDVTGRKVRTLVDGRLDAGEHVAPWDGRSDDGARVPSGLYVMRMQAAGVTATAKALLVK